MMKKKAPTLVQKEQINLNFVSLFKIYKFLSKTKKTRQTTNQADSNLQFEFVNDFHHKKYLLEKKNIAKRVFITRDMADNLTYLF